MLKRAGPWDKAVATKSLTIRSTLSYPDGDMNPEDFLRFIQLGSFEADWKRLGLDDEDLQALEVLIMIEPTSCPVVPGTGGLRKIRFSPSRWHRGKSGGIRVCFAYFPRSSVVTLLVAYGKNEADDLSSKQKVQIKQLIETIDDLLATGA